MRYASRVWSSTTASSWRWAVSIFEVPEGTVFGLLGPNGAGKTTAVRILATILKPDGGHAEVLGHDVVKEAPAVRRRIGLAGQYAAVDANLTGRENLRMVGILGQMPTPQIMPRAAELLEKFELSDAADRPLRTYSGGMRRRLDIAASLVTRPPVLFLDEPTTGLDLTSRNALWETIEQLVADGTTVMLTTQYLEEADRLAERIAVVDGGLTANDTPTNLKSQLDVADQDHVHAGVLGESRAGHVVGSDHRDLVTAALHLGKLGERQLARGRCAHHESLLQWGIVDQTGGADPNRSGEDGWMKGRDGHVVDVEPCSVENPPRRLRIARRECPGEGERAPVAHAPAGRFATRSRGRPRPARSGAHVSRARG